MSKSKLVMCENHARTVNLHNLCQIIGTCTCGSLLMHCDNLLANDE